MNGFEIRFPEGSLLKGKEEEFQAFFLRLYTSVKHKEEPGRETGTFKMELPDHLGGGRIEYKKLPNLHTAAIRGIDVVLEEHSNKAAA